MFRSKWNLLICDLYMPTMTSFLEFTVLHVSDCTYFAFDITSSFLAYNLFESCSCMIMMLTRVKASDTTMNFINFLNYIIQENFGKGIQSNRAFVTAARHKNS